MCCCWAAAGMWLATVPCPGVGTRCLVRFAVHCLGCGNGMSVNV